MNATQGGDKKRELLSKLLSRQSSLKLCSKVESVKTVVVKNPGEYPTITQCIKINAGG